MGNKSSLGRLIYSGALVPAPPTTFSPFGFGRVWPVLPGAGLPVFDLILCRRLGFQNRKS